MGLRVQCLFLGLGPRYSWRRAWRVLVWHLVRLARWWALCVGLCCCWLGWLVPLLVGSSPILAAGLGCRAGLWVVPLHSWPRVLCWMGRWFPFFLAWGAGSCRSPLFLAEGLAVLVVRLG